MSDEASPFGEPEIAFPGEERAGGVRARIARKNLDADLAKIKRRKRFGVPLLIFSVLFCAVFLVPVTWAAIYRVVLPPGTTLMLARAAEGERIRHESVPIERISPHLVRAVIAAEDARFCEHNGFDVEAIQEAMKANERGGRVRGASTVSQQTAKNVFLWPARSWLRKGLETYFTGLIEFMWPKRRIMESYLNVAEWGDGIFGAEAAAQARFGVSAAQLTPMQAARLAAVLPNPHEWRADRPGPYVRRRAATILQRARVVGNEGLANCELRPQGFELRPPPQSCCAGQLPRERGIMSGVSSSSACGGGGSARSAETEGALVRAQKFHQFAAEEWVVVDGGVVAGEGDGAGVGHFIGEVGDVLGEAIVGAGESERRDIGAEQAAVDIAR